MAFEKQIVSVLMPVYNGGEYLRPAIDSILNQTYKNFEFVIIDDGSTDGTKEILADYPDPRIVLITHEKNKGLIHSLNEGIEISKGKYIVRMDADDISLASRIEKQVAFMNRNPDIGAAGTEYYSFSETKLKKVFAYADPEVLRALLLFKSCLCHPSVIIRKSILTENKIRYNENCKHAEDFDLWIQLSKISKLSNLKEFLLKYRSHGQKVSVVHTDIQKDISSEIREKYLKDLGFNFTQQDLETNQIIATNRLIKTEEILISVENWLLKLIEQNNHIKAIEPVPFNFLLGKTWLDSCGITNLGATAYSRYFRSDLANYYPLSSKEKVKFLAKCTIRRFKK